MGNSVNYFSLSLRTSAQREASVKEGSIINAAPGFRESWPQQSSASKANRKTKALQHHHIIETAPVASINAITYNLRLLNGLLQWLMAGSVCLSSQPTSYPSHCDYSICGPITKEMMKLPVCAHAAALLPKDRRTCTVCVTTMTMHARDECTWAMTTPISICLHCFINVLSWSRQLLSLFVEEDGSLPFHSGVILLQFKSADSIKSVTIFSAEDDSLQ